MSARRSRFTLVWIAVAILFVAAFSQIKPVSMVTLPGYGYRAYEWKWVVEFQNMLSNIAGQFPHWQTTLYDAALSEWEKQTDEKGDPIVIYQGITITSYDWETTQYQDRVRATFKAEVHLWFYGYFPNGIPEATPLPARPSIPDLFDFLIPEVHALATIAIIVIAICALLATAIIVTGAITILNLLNERQRWEDIVDDPNIPPVLKWLYAVIQSVLGWFQSLGPMAIILVAAVAAILIYGKGGSGKKR